MREKKFKLDQKASWFAWQGFDSLADNMMTLLEHDKTLTENEMVDIQNDLMYVRKLQKDIETTFGIKGKSDDG